MKIIQFPNAPLIVALAASFLSMLTAGKFQAAFSAVFFMALTVWAYEEVRHGSNWFRRSLGAFVALYIVYSLTMKIAS